MEGLFIGQSGEYIEKVSKCVEELSLIAKGDSTEVMLQRIQPDTVVTVSPGEDEELMEFFYILSGSMVYDQEGKQVFLNQGDFFYVRKLQDTVYFKTLTEVEMIYFSTQPVFHLLSNEIEQLKNILNELKKKDPYTHDHDVRICEFSMRIGEALKLSKDQLEILYYSMLFHDIGKINIPNEILNKPGTLTEEEFRIVRKHPTDGKNLLNKTFLKKVGEIVEQHHERLDGSGYPYGLKENEISIEAKIIAVVDSYDAMTSDRAYRKALSHEEAMADLWRHVEEWYDIGILKIFERILNKDGH